MKDRPCKKCSACLACLAVCPTGAIEAQSSCGFIKPKINEAVCIDCAACVAVCPELKEIPANDYTQRAFAFSNSDKDVLEKSTSGGAFSALAESVIAKGGAVYGCVLSEGLVPKHIRVEDGSYCRMRGSKYVMSDMSGIHESLCADLASGRRVLFTGAPCQCASVRSYCDERGINTENLLIADFICYGTPSPSVFMDYVAYCEKRSGKKLKSHIFRSKINGWTKHTEMNIFDDGSVDFESYESQLFKGIFYSHLAMNDSCFECKYARGQRVSDITMADFWGVASSRPELFCEEGVSFLLVNSEEGERAVSEISGDALTEVLPTDSAQPHLLRPCEKPRGYEKFLRDYSERGFEYVVKKYFHGGRLRRAASKIYRLVLGVFKKK